ncbi:MAG TPA: hypothetical protein VF109_04600, partial [Mycobacteriales bacterium]
MAIQVVAGKAEEESGTSVVSAKAAASWARPDPVNVGGSRTEQRQLAAGAVRVDTSGAGPRQ